VDVMGWLGIWGDGRCWLAMIQGFESDGFGSVLMFKYVMFILAKGDL
jgi:hypothetical protein